MPLGHRPDRAEGFYSLIKDFDQHSRNVKDGSKVMESFSDLSSKTKQGLDKASQLESHRDSLVQAKESKEQELRLLQKQIEKLSKELEGVENQLAVLEDDCGLLKQESYCLKCFQRDSE